VNQYADIRRPQWQACELTQEVKVFTFGTTAELILKPDPMRIAVQFSGGQSGDSWVGFDPQVTTATGIYVTGSWTPMLISDDRLPGAAGRGWYAVGNVATNTLVALIVRIT